MVKTAGKILSENDLRDYMKCPRLYDFGGEGKHFSPKLLLAKTVIEKMTCQAIRKPIGNPMEKVPKYVSGAAIELGFRKLYLEPQVNHLENQTVQWLGDYFSIFKPSQYLPVSGPIPWRIQISKTPIEIMMPCVYRRTKNATLNLMFFTPYSTPQDRLNDPVIHLLLQSTKHLVKPNAARAQVRIHLLHHGIENSVGYTNIDSNEVNEEYMRMLSRTIKVMEAGWSYPIVPCRFPACPYKEQCIPR